MLSPFDKLECVFGDNDVVNRAAMSPDTRGQIICALPMPGQLPFTPEQQGGSILPLRFLTGPLDGGGGQVLTRCLSVCVCVFADFVSVPVKIYVNQTIKVTSGEYHFYNCAAAIRKNPNTP